VARVLIRVQEANNFETKLESQFGINPRCHGIVLVPGINPPVKDNWFLTILYTTGRPMQEWGLSKATNEFPLFHQIYNGEGNPEKTANDVCVIIISRMDR
jgi:hypothetical protein